LNSGRLQLRRRPSQIAGSHERQKDFQLFECELFVDLHGVGLRRFLFYERPIVPK
jgi:hypothetical protein